MSQVLQYVVETAVEKGIEVIQTLEKAGPFVRFVGMIPSLKNHLTNVWRLTNYIH